MGQKYVTIPASLITFWLAAQQAMSPGTRKAPCFAPMRTQRGNLQLVSRLPFTALAANHVRSRDALGGIARVDDEPGFTDDPIVVVVGVIGDDQHAVVLPKVFERR